MRSDFDLIVHEICDKEIKIYPIADVHFGALEHDTQAWAKFISKVASEANSYIILAGDLINNNTDGVDCVIAGHTHKGAITRPSKIVIDEINDMVTIKDYVVLSCVSWQNFGAYPLQQMMQPTTVARPQSIRLISRPKEIELVW